MPRTRIPEDVRSQAEQVVARFNSKLKGKVEYIVRFQGSYLYLDRDDHGAIGQVCRLGYTGQFDKWKFAIFKYSSERYDPDEWFFPGSELVDGTIEGAMRAGLEAYPP